MPVNETLKFKLSPGLKLILLISVVKLVDECILTVAGKVPELLILNTVSFVSPGQRVPKSITETSVINLTSSFLAIRLIDKIESGSALVFNSKNAFFNPASLVLKITDSCFELSGSK